MRPGLARVNSVHVPLRARDVIHCGSRCDSVPQMSPRAEPSHAVLAAIEHTLLSPAATARAVEALCAEAVASGFRGVCVNPMHVARCARQLEGSGRIVVSVVGFPLGATYARCKALESELAVADGAGEIDMVMQLGAAMDGDFKTVEIDAREVVRAAGGKPVKLILEVGLLDEEQKRRACEAAEAAGIAFVKTCSGFATGAATVEDVMLLRRCVGNRLGIKASGGIRSAAQAQALLAAGADRLGTSSGIQIARELATQSKDSG